MYLHKGGECLKRGRKHGKENQLQSLQLSLVNSQECKSDMKDGFTTTLPKYLVRFNL